jgi:TonB-dependent SusC/RagA subfamily outer membrane receptor
MFTISGSSSSSRAQRVLAHAVFITSLLGCYHAPSGVASVAPSREMAEQERRTFPGVDLVPMANGAFLVQIHSGLTTGGEPLYVIDGAPTMISPSRGIDWFKPEDIEQIRVLKDPSETAIYGPRAVHGVIVISTRQAARTRGR